MSGGGGHTQHNADGRLRSLIERILRLKEEQDALAADIREVYAEAKGEGYDKTAMGQLVAYLRKVEKVGVSAIEEGQTVFDLYLDAYQRATGTVVATHTHEESRAKASEDNGRTSGGAAPVTGEVSRAHGPDHAGGTPLPIRRDSVERHAPIPVSVEPSSPAETEKAGEVPLASSATISDADVPDFLVKQQKPLRPDCLEPTNCAGYGAHTCHRCTVAAREGVAA